MRADVLEESDVNCVRIIIDPKWTPESRPRETLPELYGTGEVGGPHGTAVLA